MLKIKDLTVSYDELPVIKDLNLEVKSGEICTIVGPSGCGKTTLLRAVAGLIEVDTGEITLDGQPVSKSGHTIGLVPQHHGLLPWKKVAANIEVGLKIKRPAFSKQERVQLIEDVLERCGISAHGKKYPRQLSGGQRQRVAIGRAFVLNPDLLLMDESFASLDTVTKEDMQQFLLELWDGQANPALFVTHDIEEAVTLGDRVVLMLAGGKVYEFEGIHSGRGTSEFTALCQEIRTMMKAGMKRDE